MGYKVYRLYNMCYLKHQCCSDGSQVNTGWFLLHRPHTVMLPSCKPSTPPGAADTPCRPRASPPPCSGLCRPHTPTLHLCRRPRPPGCWRPTWSGPGWFWKQTSVPGWWAWCPGPSSPASSQRGGRRWSGSRTGPGGLTGGPEPPRSGRGLMMQREDGWGHVFISSKLAPCCTTTWLKVTYKIMYFKNNSNLSCSFLTIYIKLHVKVIRSQTKL